MKPLSIEDCYSDWKKGHISDQFMVYYFFVFYHEKKYPSKRLKDFLNQDQLKFEDLKGLIQNNKFKKVKQKAIDTLINWGKDRWKMILIDTIPLPHDVLNFQAEGKRPVTMIIQDEFTPILTRQDHLEFLIHDLEHGYMYFHDESLYDMQNLFFKKIEASLKTDIWKSYLKCNKFKDKFIYLISDMNTHTEHYKQYLFSMIPENEVDRFNFLFERN